MLVKCSFKENLSASFILFLCLVILLKYIICRLVQLLKESLYNIVNENISLESPKVSVVG